MQCFCDFLQKDCSEYFFIKVFAHETVYVLRGECARSLDSAGAYGGVPWLLSIMFPSPDFSEQRMEEREMVRRRKTALCGIYTKWDAL